METTPALDILARARALTDTEPVSGSEDFISTDFLLSELTSAYKRMVDLVLGTAGSGALVLLAVGDTFAEGNLTLPDECYRVVDVSRKVHDRWVALPSLNWKNRGNAADKYWPSWTVTNGSIRLYPEDATPGPLQVWYIPQVASIGSGSPVNTVNGWDDYLVACLCLAICARDERVDVKYLSMRNDAEARIKTACRSFILGETTTISRVEVYAEDYREVL